LRITRTFDFSDSAILRGKSSVSRLQRDGKGFKGFTEAAGTGILQRLLSGRWT
jgi:hypothetical protein